MSKKLLSVLLVICMVAQLVSFSALAAGDTDALPFDDVKEGDWFYDGVSFVYGSQLMIGVSDDEFAPNNPLTRAMVVTVLWRLEGKPAPQGENPFTDMDVPGQTWFQDAVTWASENEIVNGYGNGLFGPMDNISREQMAAIIYRYALYKGKDVSARADMSVFTDADEISDWAKDAMSWANAEGLIRGTTETTVSAGSPATRGQFAVIIYRLSGEGENKEEEKKEQLVPVFKVTIADGSEEPEERIVLANSRIVDIPGKDSADGKIFVGWCYDENLQQPVSSYELLEENLTLYPKYMDAEEYYEKEHNRVYAAGVQPASLTITIKSEKSTTADEIMRMIEFINASEPDDSDFYTVTGSGTSFTVKGINGSFTPGDDYKLLLNDDSLSFVLPSGAGDIDPVEYDFTAAKSEALNQRILRSNISYIPMADVSNLILNGQPANKLQVATVQITDSNDNISNIASISIEGSFTYNGTDDINVGDIVGVYRTRKPDPADSSRLRQELISSDPDVSFIEITGINGTTVQYRGAETTDVLFTPDVIPVPAAADTDGDDTNNSIKALERYFIFRDGRFAQFGLDAGTTVDAGDYLAFYTYTGDENDLTKATVTGYALISSDPTVVVEETGVYYIIDYTTVTQSQIYSSSDTYYSREITNEELNKLCNLNEVALSAGRLAENSGFSETAAMYLAASLMSTDEFSQTMLENGIDPTLLELPDTVGSSGPMLSAANPAQPRVEVSKPEIVPHISTGLVYFTNPDGSDMNGLRLTFDTTVEVTIHSKSKADIVFTISGRYEQEVKLKFGVNAKSHWNKDAFIPYIDDYTVTLNSDIYEYSGFGVEVNVTLKQGESPTQYFTKFNKVLNAVNETKDTLEYLMDTGSKILGSGEDEVMSAQLAEKYSEMIEAAGDLDWVDLVTIELLKDTHFRLLYVVDISVGVDFVISAKANITVGSQFKYSAAKRYIFTLKVFAMELTNESVDLEPEVYDYTFYAMGYLGLRAGVQLTLTVGLLSTNLDSYGVRARVGVYFEMWGYFYYVYHNEKMNGATTVNEKYAGALLFELGAFTNLAFIMQVGDNSLGLAAELYDQQWPLLTFGEQKNVQDFAWDQNDIKEVTMKFALTRAYLPDNIFTVEYLDLKDGADVIDNGQHDNEYVFFTEPRSYSDFTIEMTNDKFRYEPSTHSVTVTPDADDRELLCDMIITYKAPLTLTSKPIQRRVPLRWDDLSNNYYVVFDSMGGSHIESTVGSYRTPVEYTGDPVRKGYTFAGWYTDVACTVPGTVPETLPIGGLIFYAKWTPAMTEYTVEHYQKSSAGVYELAETEVLQAVTGTTVIPSGKTAADPGWEGFELVGKKEATVLADGSLTVRYYYTRNQYTATFTADSINKHSVEKTLYFGEPLVAPTFGEAGYIFNGWNAQVPDTMPAQNLTFTGSWTPAGDTPYTVQHKLQNTDGDGYDVPGDVEYLYGTTGATVTAYPKTFEGYSVSTVEPGVTSATISADGKTELIIYYDLNTYTVDFVTYNPDNGENGTAVASETHRTGGTLFPKRTAMKDYAFMGWYTDEARTNEFNNIMPAHDLTLYAKWEKGTGYAAAYYLMNTDGTYPQNPAYLDNRYVQEDEQTAGQLTVAVKPEDVEELPITGFKTPSSEITAYLEGTPAATGKPADQIITLDGSKVFRYEFVRNSWTFTINLNYTDSSPNSATVYYNAQLTALGTVPERNGYNFIGWNEKPDGNGAEVTAASLMPDSNYTVYAQWEAKELNYTFYDFYKNGSAKTGTFIYGATLNNIKGMVDPAEPPARDGYEFDGWYTSQNFTAAGTKKIDGTAWNEVPYEDVTLYAKWTIKEYTITINYNGGTGDYSAPIKYYVTGNKPDGTGTDFQIKPPTRTNYVFTGWEFSTTLDPNKYEYQTVSGSDNYLLIKTGLTGSFTITAKWVGETRTVGFNDNRDHFSTKSMIKVEPDPLKMTSYNLVYDAKTNLHQTGKTYEKPTCFGYDFEGWYLEDTCENKIFDSEGNYKPNSNWTEADNVTLYANWTPKTYSIVFNKGNGDASVSTMTVSASQEKVTMPSGEGTNYNVIGWKTVAPYYSSTYDYSVTYNWAVGEDVTKDLQRTIDTSEHPVFASSITLYAVCVPKKLHIDINDMMYDSSQSTDEQKYLLPSRSVYHQNGDIKTHRIIPVDDGQDTTYIFLALLKDHYEPKILHKTIPA